MHPYKKAYRELPEIVSQVKGKWSIDFAKLSEITNQHEVFIEKVRAEFGRLAKDGSYWLKNIKVFLDETDPITPSVGIAFRTLAYVSYLSCSTKHKEGQPYVLEASYNEVYISQMAEVL